MGRPVHYSSEIPMRCHALIEMLSQRVDEASDPDGRWGGPLKTTFLLAMATPMVVLPIERLFKPLVWGRGAIANDQAMDQALDARVQRQLGRGRPFQDAPFFQADAWSYVADIEAFEVGGAWPDRALIALASPKARQAAAITGAGQILVALRNSLAHGGVTYLDQDGRHTQFATNMLGFASLARQNDLTRLRLLRVSVAAFEQFLGLWAAWLKSSGVSDQLEQSGPGYFEYAAE